MRISVGPKIALEFVTSFLLSCNKTMNHLLPSKGPKEDKDNEENRKQLQA